MAALSQAARMAAHVLSLSRIPVPDPVRRLFEGFWVVPTLMSLIGALLAAGVQYLPAAFVPGIALDALGLMDVGGARAALSAVASGVMSVASIVFSLTFVTLSITAQQLSPRMLDFVLRERAVQMLIGMALATFLFASTALTFGDGREAWRLALAAVISLGMAAMALATVVAFAHRMTLVMRPDEMVALRGAAFVKAVNALALAPHGCVAADAAQAAILRRTLAQARPLRVSGAGYVGAMESAALVDIAARHDARLMIDVRANAFLAPGMIFGRADGLDPDCDRDVIAALLLTDRRTLGAAASYEAQALSEAAIRALSPGINDPATALSCVNRLFEGASAFALNPPAPEAFADRKGVARLVRARFDLRALLADAIAPISYYGDGDPRIAATLIALAGHLREQAPRAADREALAAFAADVRARSGRGRHERAPQGPAGG